MLRMSPPLRITAPSEKPVALADVKAHCRIDHSDDDLLVGSYIDAAVAHADGWAGVLGRCLVTQTWRQTSWRWCPCVRLAFPDVTGLVITYIDTEGATQTVDAAQYELLADAVSSFVRFKPEFTAPAAAERGDAIRYTMTAGYGAAADVPAAIKMALFMLVAHWYNNREASSADRMAEMPFAVSSLLAPYRRTGV